MEEKKQPIELPENAFRELKEGEEYQPIMSPNKTYPEVNAWSVSWGIVMAVIFSVIYFFICKYTFTNKCIHIFIFIINR